MNEIMRNELKEYGADIDGAIKRFMGNEGLYSKFLLKFLDDKNFAGLKENIAAGDFEEAYKCVHAMKGVTANLGLTPMYDITNEMSDYMRKDPAAADKDKVVQMFEELEAKYVRFCEIIKED